VLAELSDLCASEHSFFSIVWVLLDSSAGSGGVGRLVHFLLWFRLGRSGGGGWQWWPDGWLGDNLGTEKAVVHLLEVQNCLVAHGDGHGALLDCDDATSFGNSGLGNQVELEVVDHFDVRKFDFSLRALDEPSSLVGVLVSVARCYRYPAWRTWSYICERLAGLGRTREVVHGSSVYDPLVGVLPGRNPLRSCHE